jgi:hypothetical protein
MRRYEILVAGRIGPGAAAGLPGFTAVITTTATVLTGTAADAADLRAVLAVLRARGLAATFLRIAPRGQS